MSLTDKVTAYCDGSCNNHTHDKGGYGVHLSYRGKVKRISGGSYSNTTSARMEIMAAIVAMEELKPGYHIEIISDSQYVVKAVTDGWLESWEVIDFVGKKNVDLWKRFLKAYKKFPKGTLEFKWIKGHAGHKYNEIVDQLAKRGGLIENVIIDVNSGVL